MGTTKTAPDSFSRLNSIMTLLVADLERRGGDAAISLQGGQTQRSVAVVGGEVVSAVSNVKRERLGDMLVEEGKLDIVLLEPVAEEAKKHKRLLGDQLVEDKLLTPTELAEALDRQLQLRFEGALQTPGQVTIEDKAIPKSAYHLPLSEAVMNAFRHRVPLAAIELHLADPDRGETRLDLASPGFTRLSVGPSELRVCRRLAQGESLAQLLAAGFPREPVLRLCGALSTLGLWSERPQTGLGPG